MQYLQYLKHLFFLGKTKDLSFNDKRCCFYEQPQEWLFSHALKISLALIHSHWFSFILIDSILLFKTYLIF